MKKYILSLANYISQKISNKHEIFKNRQVSGYSIGGDAQFNIDDIAENAVIEFITKNKKPVAFYTEDGGLRIIGKNPKYIFIIDPIDGTRAAAAGLEMSCISIALARFSEKAKIMDIEFALLKELKSGAYIYGDCYHNNLFYKGYFTPLPNISNQKDMRNMFWSIEFNGHPAELMTQAYGHIIDYSANNGGIFIFNSASFSISRIITGQLDAYVDIGNRLLKDNPSLLQRFKNVGNGKVLHLFPYDIAASVFLAEKAGIIITDAYGNSLKNTLLTDLRYENQQSCIAASTRELHRKLLESINYKIPKNMTMEVDSL